MADERVLEEPEVTFEFNLPHGIDDEELTLGGTEEARCESEHHTVPRDPFSYNGPGNYSNLGQVNIDEHELNCRRFSPGFSDDEGSGEAFERSWPSHQANKQAAKAARGKKSPRRSDSEGEHCALRARKRLRQPVLSGVNEDERVDSLSTPATPGHGLGNCMSSLTLHQQQDGGRMERPMINGFGLACSDIGSVRDSSDDEFVIPPDTEPYYELRQNIDRQKAVTHVDTDKSGNFDPEQEAKEIMTKLVRAKASKKRKHDTRKRKCKSNAVRDLSMKCIVMLPFDAFGNVRNITNDEQNWPEGWSEVESEQERELEQYRAAFRTNTPDRELQLPLEDPANRVDDLTGYPAARGCQQCRRLEQPCSMVKDGKYPCRECVEDGGQCQPIQEPAVKGRCKACDQANKEVCSFEHNPTQPICDYCAHNNRICEALPPDGYQASRINIEEVIWGPDRPYVACTACRKEKKRCTLKGKEDKPPCKYCAKNNLGCTFYHLHKPDTKKQTAKKTTLLATIAPEVSVPKSDLFTAEDLEDMGRQSAQVLERESTPEIEMEDGLGNKGILTKIMTSFAHPIRFETEDCEFCEIPIFGMVGYFEREVHVIRWYNGQGYAEVGGGHCQDTASTSMCKNCSNRRLQIVICPRHEFEQLVDAAIDHDVLAEELTEAETGGADIQYQLQRWCSICFSPAFYGCCTVQPDIRGEKESEITGCHLRLCVACERSLREDHRGDFDLMVTEMDAKPKISEADEILEKEIKGKPRADVGFLKEDGLLMQSVSMPDE